MKLSERADESAAALASADICVKHSYRNIKIAPGTTVTIDIEELKERQKQKIYQHLYPFQPAT